MPSLADGEILVRTAYASVCGSDLHVVYGGAPPRPGEPGFPGHESVGEVVVENLLRFAKRRRRGRIRRQELEQRLKGFTRADREAVAADEFVEPGLRRLHGRLAGLSGDGPSVSGDPRLRSRSMYEA